MTVVAIAGHQKLPRRAVPYIREAIERQLATTPGPIVGVSSLAEGADQLFADILLQQGGQLHVVIPSRQYEGAFTTEAARQRYRRLLSKSALVHALPYPKPTEDAFLKAGQKAVDLSDLLIAVWDGKPSRGKGGTADIVHYARALPRPVVVIWPEGVSR